MKKILITGKDSYIGNSVRDWLLRRPDEYTIEVVDMIDGSWENRSFSGFDTVFHVAGIAHVSSDPKLKSLYDKVNRELTVKTATKAKADGVDQFIFMSSLIVYGDSRKDDKPIDRDTIPIPGNIYGDSKLQAENGIQPLADDDFKVVVLRPPMIYGPGSKGNYPILSSYAQKLPFFPDMDNHRSMLFIDNLCEFIRLMIDNRESGLFFPQNREYARTSSLVHMIAKAHHKDIFLTKLFNPILRLLIGRVGIVSKVFGNLTYDLNISTYKTDYRVCSLEESIIKTETPDNR